MTTTTYDLLHGTDHTVPSFAVHVSVVRYLPAGDPASAATAAAQGIELARGEIAGTPVVVEAAALGRTDALPYTHAGEDGLWRVSIDIDAVVRADSERAATEAAHQLAIVRRGSGDAFEPELEVFPVDRLR